MKPVFMYTLSTCPWCRKAKKYFADHNIPFKYVDYDLESVEQQEKIEQEMNYPGEIKVTVLREVRAVEYAR